MRATVVHPALRLPRYLGLWTLVGVFFFSQYVAQSFDSREPVRWLRVLECYLLRAYVWALLAPMVVSLAHRLRLTIGYPARWIVVHFLLGSAVATVVAVLTGCAGNMLEIPGYLPGLRAAVPMALASGFHSDLFTYWIIVGACEVFDRYRSDWQAEIESARLKSERVQAQLDVFKNQLHPHFLLNALNAIMALIRRRRNAQAEELTGRLGELLHGVLNGIGTQEVSLGQELQFLQAYLDIERIRYGERLRIDLRIEPGLRDALVPYMCLQPLAENAIRHGIACRTGPGTLTISARVRQTSLEITVADDGVGFDPAHVGVGIGIPNTRARLGHLYGPGAYLHINTSLGLGTLVTLSIPHHVVEVAEPGPPLQAATYSRRH